MSEVPKYLEVWFIFFSSDSLFSPTISLSHQSPWYGSQGSGHFKWNGKSSHSWWWAVQERRKKRGNLINNFEPEMRAEVTERLKSLLGHTASVQSVSHQRTRIVNLSRMSTRTFCSYQRFRRDQEHTQHDGSKKFSPEVCPKGTPRLAVSNLNPTSLISSPLWRKSCVHISSFSTLRFRNKNLKRLCVRWRQWFWIWAKPKRTSTCLMIPE